jgi:hypothetical protein
MQDIIDRVDAAGKTAWVAKIPPEFNDNGTPNSTGNQRVQQYNSAIDGLQNYMEGPDFYDYFLGSGLNRSSLVTDTVHFNGLGYLIIAYLWHNSLSPSAQLPLPMVIDNLDPLDYKQNLLEVGDEYYIDRSHTLTNIPQEIENGIWIMTADDDRNNATRDFLTFEIDRSVRVYVAYDSNASVLPDWLLAFTNTGLQVGTSNGLLDLYSKDYPDGLIELDGNKAGGGTGSKNYLVIVKES